MHHQKLSQSLSLSLSLSAKPKPKPKPKNSDAKIETPLFDQKGKPSGVARKPRRKKTTP